MRIFTIDADALKTRLSKELFEANTVVNELVSNHLELYNGPFADILRKNIQIAKQTGLPLCQDTGMVEFFIFVGKNVFLGDIFTLLNQIVREVYTTNPFRYAVVSDPLFKRRNTGDNTPAIVHVIHWEKEAAQIRFLIKGGGSENLSRLFMLEPGCSKQMIIDKVVEHIAENGRNACPPLKIGIGIGGSSEKAMLMSKIALTKDEPNSDTDYAELESEICQRINQLNIGYQGLGVGISCYAAYIEYFPTHIATLPVAISVDCYLCRKGIIDVELIEIDCG